MNNYYLFSDNNECSRFLQSNLTAILVIDENIISLAVLLHFLWEIIMNYDFLIWY